LTIYNLRLTNCGVKKINQINTTIMNYAFKKAVSNETAFLL
jgi:hypothetical protein